jgi:hypothetical protein
MLGLAMFLDTVRSRQPHVLSGSFRLSGFGWTRRTMRVGGFELHDNIVSCMIATRYYFVWDTLRANAIQLRCNAAHV